jgi:adenosylcobyric acid synthase
VAVRLTASAAEVADADLVVLPGSKSTVDDLEWLHGNGLASAIETHARAGGPVLGICGGYQMLGERIHDDVESGRGTVPGLGLLPVEVTFAKEKTLAASAGRAFGAVDVSGYEIHHGYESRPAPVPLIRRADGSGEGAVAGTVFGTHWHGTLESDGFRRAFLTEVARLAGRKGYVVATDTVFAQRREHLLDLLGDLVERHLDTDALLRMIESGPPPDLPFIPAGAAR